MLEFSYPRHKVNMISGLVQMYSTVGVLVPICRRKMLLNIWTASFLPSKSMRCRFLNKARIKPVLYISWLNWANTMSDCWSDSFPNKSCFMFVNCLERSSWAWKIHIKKKSKYIIVWTGGRGFAKRWLEVTWGGGLSKVTSLLNVEKCTIFINTRI